MDHFIQDMNYYVQGNENDDSRNGILIKSKVGKKMTIALYKALSEGYTQVQAVGVTSDHKDQLKPLCGACRQLYMYINPKTTIFYVFGKDKKVKLKEKIVGPITTEGM